MAQSIAKTPSTLTSEILLKAQDNPAHFLLLEGDFDLRFWETRLNFKALRPVECGGKSTVLATLELLRGQTIGQRVLGLVDADFDRLLNRAQPPLVVYTDESDLETSLLLLQCSSPMQMYMERLLAATVDAEQRSHFEQQCGCSLVEHIRRTALQFGLLRLLNEQQQWCVSFQDISVLNPQWFDRDNLTLGTPELHRSFLAKLNDVGHGISQEQLTALIQTCEQVGWLKSWQLVQGHDLMAVLATFMNSPLLRRPSGRQQVSQASLQRDLRLLHWQDLQACQMIQTISANTPQGVACFRT